MANECFMQPDQALVAGFVNPTLELGFRATKAVANRLRARMVAVDAWVTTGERLRHKALADRLGITSRGLSYQFEHQSELYAFPPTELARSLSSTTADFSGWTEVAASTVPVFEALNGNQCGRSLMAGLVRLHRTHPDLCKSDGYFEDALRSAIETKHPRHTLAITGLFTDGIRAVFQDWVDYGEPDLQYVSERIARLLQGPIHHAYDALMEPVM